MVLGFENFFFFFKHNDNKEIRENTNVSCFLKCSCLLDNSFLKHRFENCFCSLI